MWLIDISRGKNTGWEAAGGLWFLHFEEKWFFNVEQNKTIVFSNTDPSKSSSNSERSVIGESVFKGKYNWAPLNTFVNGQKDITTKHSLKHFHRLVSSF